MIEKNTPARPLLKRAIVRISPSAPEESAADFLQGLLTNDVTGDLPQYAGLLSPQGKTLFDMIVWRDGGSILLDCQSRAADLLVKRLSLYRLRRKLEISRDESFVVLWSPSSFKDSVPDPRLAQLGHRAISAKPALDSQAGIGADQDWLLHRLSLGVPEGTEELADVLWLETNAIELNGVSFTKGCYIGQENTARMNWRSKINRRLLVTPLSISQEKRRKIAYPELELAIDHLRIADIKSANTPEWLDLNEGA